MDSNINNDIIWNSNYKRLLCYQKSVVIYDLTHHFCSRFVKVSDRTYDQMIQAARSGKQNIVEGYADMATSKEMGIKLFNVARGSLFELYEDYNDYLRVRNLLIWESDSEEWRAMAQLGVSNSDPRYFVSLAESRNDETIANMAIVLIKQAQFLLQKYLDKVNDNFSNEGGFREKMTRKRVATRNNR